MKHPFNARAPAVDTDAIQQTIQRALASAGLDTDTGPMRAVTETIRRALAGGGGAADDAAVVDVEARVVPEGGEGAAGPRRAPSGRHFDVHEFRNEAGSRAYKLHVPASRPDGPCAMVVMLHGCTQSADDFAAGTQMNRLADEHGFLVVYPEQAAQANPQRCWNWFQPQDQVRGRGEPSLIAGIVDEVAQRHGADRGRIYVAGLSAGAAMAVVLGESYPELFAGVGAHSGLPYGSAQDVPSALAAMKGGRSGLPGLKDLPVSRRRAVQPVPVIVFHGDRDHTVQAGNGAQIVQQALQAHGPLQSSTETGISAAGRRFSRTVHADADGRARVEHWTVHGAGHAWSGGDASGSYTDGGGPDASAAMVRFFLALPPAGSA